MFGRVSANMKGRLFPVVSALALCALFGCAGSATFSGAAGADEYVFGCDCIVNDCLNELNTPEGRRRAVDWFRRHHVSKIYVESFRHGQAVPTELLRTIRDEFRAAGLVTGGCFTPTSMAFKSRAENAAKMDYQQWCCYTDPDVLAVLDAEVARAASLFDFVIIDDFLFTHCTCERCARAKGSASWADFRCALIRDVCRRIDAAAKRANPNCTFIVKFPCWYAGFRDAGYDVAADAKLLGAAWIGTETRDAGEPAQAFWIQAWANEATGGLCGGGWFDALMTSDPRKYVEQARYTILGGAKETLLHCHWHLAAPEPPVDPKHDYRRVIRWHDCAEAFRQEVEGLEKLAALVRGAELEGVRWARAADATGSDRGVRMLRGGVPVKPVLAGGEPTFPFDENRFAASSASDLKAVHDWVAARTGWRLDAPGDVTFHLYRKNGRRFAALVNLRDETVEATLSHREGGALAKALSLPSDDAVHCGDGGKIRLSPKSLALLELTERSVPAVAL